jgi:hypothetical protein
LGSGPVPAKGAMSKPVNEIDECPCFAKYR